MPETDTPLWVGFDDGLGPLTHHWGGNIDWSVPSQVTLTGHGGFMEFPGGPESGHGYGTYTVNARLDGGQPGPAILLWPGDDQWPGQEIDMVEVLPDGSGRHYGTLHWDYYGSDAYQSHVFDGVYGGTFHEYTTVWEPGRITWLVDGQVQGVATENVPRDYDNGGMNNAIGIMNINDATSITVRDISYTPLGDGGWSPEPSPPQEPGGSSGGGDGPDRLTVRVSGDEYEGHARFVIKVDGAQVGGEHTAWASERQGEQDVIRLRGDWDGAREVSVEFLNDRWDGTSATDRNLYVHSVRLNGEEVGGYTPMYSAGEADFWIG